MGTSSKYWLMNVLITSRWRGTLYLGPTDVANGPVDQVEQPGPAGASWGFDPAEQTRTVRSASPSLDGSSPQGPAPGGPMHGESEGSAPGTCCAPGLPGWRRMHKAIGHRRI